MVAGTAGAASRRLEALTQLTRSELRLEELVAMTSRASMAELFGSSFLDTSAGGDERRGTSETTAGDGGAAA